jgi:hypothetical protein
MGSDRRAQQEDIPIWRNRMETVTGITSDLNRLSCGWMKFEAGARLSYSIEIFAEGEGSQEGCSNWGRAFAEGIAEFYGLAATRSCAARSVETCKELGPARWARTPMRPENVVRSERVGLCQAVDGRL